VSDILKIELVRYKGEREKEKEKKRKRKRGIEKEKRRREREESIHKERERERERNQGIKKDVHLPVVYVPSLSDCNIGERTVYSDHVSDEDSRATSDCLAFGRVNNNNDERHDERDQLSPSDVKHPRESRSIDARSLCRVVYRHCRRDIDVKHLLRLRSIKKR
jgi:hypothetical protein